MALRVAGSAQRSLMSTSSSRAISRRDDWVRGKPPRGDEQLVEGQASGAEGGGDAVGEHDRLGLGQRRRQGDERSRSSLPSEKR